MASAPKKKSGSSSSAGSNDDMIHEARSDNTTRLENCREDDVESMVSGQMSSDEAEIQNEQSDKIETNQVETKLISFKDFQKYLTTMRVPISEAEALALVLALTEYVMKYAADQIFNLFRNNAKDKSYTNVGKSAWTEVLRTSTYHKWLDLNRGGLKLAVKQTNKTRQFHGWTSLDGKSSCPEFCDFMSMFVVIMMEANNKKLPKEAKAEIIQGIADKAMKKAFDGPFRKVQVSIDFATLNIEKDKFPKAVNQNIMKEPFFITSSNRNSSPYLFAAFAETHTIFLSHNAKEIEFTKQMKIYDEMAFEMGERFLEAMGTYEKFSAARTEYTRLGAKILDNESDETVLQKVIKKLPRNDTFQKKAATWLENAIIEFNQTEEKGADFLNNDGDDDDSLDEDEQASDDGNI